MNDSPPGRSCADGLRRVRLPGTVAVPPGKPCSERSASPSRRMPTPPRTATPG